VTAALCLAAYFTYDILHVTNHYWRACVSDVCQGAPRASILTTARIVCVGFTYRERTVAHMSHRHCDRHVKTVSRVGQHEANAHVLNASPASRTTLAAPSDAYIMNPPKIYPCIDLRQKRLRCDEPAQCLRTIEGSGPQPASTVSMASLASAAPSAAPSAPAGASSAGASSSGASVAASSMSASGSPFCLAMC